MLWPWQENTGAFDPDLVVLGVLAQLFAGLFLASAAGKGRPRHLLMEALGGTPRNLDFLRDALYARVRGQAGAVFLLAGAGLLLTGFLIPGPGDWRLQTAGIVAEAVVAAAFIVTSNTHVERTLRRLVRQYLQQEAFAFEDHLSLTREIGELFGVPSATDDTLESYVAKVKAAVGVAVHEVSPGYRRPAGRAVLR